jgi:hypothetical protein
MLVQWHGQQPSQFKAALSIQSCSRCHMLQYAMNHCINSNQSQCKRDELGICYALPKSAYFMPCPVVLLSLQRGRAVDPGMQQLMQAAGAPASHGQPPPTPGAAAVVCADSPLRYDLTELAGMCVSQADHSHNRCGSS